MQYSLAMAPPARKVLQYRKCRLALRLAVNYETDLLRSVRAAREMAAMDPVAAALCAGEQCGHGAGDSPLFIPERSSISLFKGSA